MAEHSNIEWTDATWNPSTGCNAVSPGCEHCYAETLSVRLQKAQPTGRYRNGFKFTEHDDPKILLDPLRWKKPRRIFTCSMSDLFHERATEAHLDRVFAVMAACPQHTFLVLTKRPHRMRDYLRGLQRALWKNQGRPDYASDRLRAFMNRVAAIPGDLPRGIALPAVEWPFPNVWLGTTVENQAVTQPGWYPGYPDVPGRIDSLLDSPAAVRFLSCEPLLGPLNLSQWLTPNLGPMKGKPLEPEEPWAGTMAEVPPTPGVPSAGEAYPASPVHLDNGLGVATASGESRELRPTERSASEARRINWIITGGESGQGARPMHPDWARSLRDQCAAAGVAFFFKQWGEWMPMDHNDPVHSDAPYGEFHDPPKPGEDIGESDPKYHHWCLSCLCAEGTGTMARVGKKRAGHLLDGETHQNWPEASCG